MALNYTNLFTDLGILVKYYNAFATTGQGLATIVSAIVTQFDSTTETAVIDGLRPGEEESWESEYAGRRGVLAGYAQGRLLSDSVLLNIGATSADLSQVFLKLSEKMIADAQTINASSTSVGSVTANSGNTGNGTILVTQLLDRLSSPGGRQGVSFPALHVYGGLTSELTISETMTVRCTADSFVDRASEGAETFSWEGGFPDTQHGVATTEGSGNIGSIQGIHANTSRYLQNADFETFTVANTPDSWTIAAGTVGTHIKKTTGNVYHGAAGLNLVGDGSLAAITLTQAVSPDLLDAGRLYCFTCRVKADATIAAGDLTIKFTGTGYTAGTTEKVSVAHGSLPTSFTLKSFFVLLPLEIPSDFALSISWAGTPTNAKNLYIDDLGFDKVNYGAGLGIVAVRGSTPFARDDRFTCALTATEGVFQRFFRRELGIQLPSDAAAGETISDSLAS